MTKIEEKALSKKIFEATQMGYEEKLRKLILQLKKFSDCSEADCTEALELASEKGYAPCVKLLIPVSKPKAGKSCALLWASFGGHTECVKLLIPVSDPKSDNSGALRLASMKDHQDCVELLLPHSDISKFSDKEWLKISSDMQNIIRSYYSKTSLEQNVLFNNQISDSKKIHKI